MKREPEAEEEEEEETSPSLAKTHGKTPGGGRERIVGARGRFPPPSAAADQQLQLEW